MEHGISLTIDQLCALADLLLGLAHADGDYDFLEAGEINDVFAELIEGAVPVEIARQMAQFNPEEFQMKDAADLLLEGDVDSNAVVNLLIQVANADANFEAAEHEYVSQVADLLGAPLEDLEEDHIEVIEVAPPPLPT